MLLGGGVDSVYAALSAEAYALPQFILFVRLVKQSIPVSWEKAGYLNGIGARVSEF